MTVRNGVGNCNITANQFMVGGGDQIFAAAATLSIDGVNLVYSGVPLYLAPQSITFPIATAQVTDTIQQAATTWVPGGQQVDSDAAWGWYAPNVFVNQNLTAQQVQATTWQASSVFAINQNAIYSGVPLFLAPRTITFPIAEAVAANTPKFTSASTVLAVNANLIAASSQRMAALATLPINASVTASTAQIFNAIAVLPITLSVIATTGQQAAAVPQPTQLMAPLQRWRWYSDAGFIEQSALPFTGPTTWQASAVFAIGTSIAASLFLPGTRWQASSVFAINTTYVGEADPLEIFVRGPMVGAARSWPRWYYNDGEFEQGTITFATGPTTWQASAVLPITLSVIANSQQGLAARTVFPINVNFAGAASRYTNALATLPIGVNFYGQASRYTNAVTSLPVNVSLIGAASRYGVAAATLPMVLSLAANFPRYTAGSSTLSIETAFYAFAFTPGQPTKWPGSAVYQIDVNMYAATRQVLATVASLPVNFSFYAGTVQRLAARASQPINVALAADAPTFGRAAASLSMAASLVGAGAVYRPTSAVFPVNAAMVANVNQFLSAYAAQRIDTQFYGDSTHFGSLSSIQPAEAFLVANGIMLEAAEASSGAEIGLIATANIVTPGPAVASETDSLLLNMQINLKLDMATNLLSPPYVRLP